MNTLTLHQTHIDTIREIDDSLIQMVCNLIGWTYEEYCFHQLENYITFVDRMFENYPVEMANQVKYSPLFRGFWNNEASLRNQNEFIPFAIFEPDGSDVILSEFLYTHNPSVLMNDDSFMNKYNRELEKIRKDSKC